MPLKSQILNLKSNWLFRILAVCLLLTLAVVPVFSATGPNSGIDAVTSATNQLTRGWKPVPLKFQIQKPFDLQLEDRYSYDAASDTHDFWIFFTDKPHDPPPNKTTARTEMRLESFRDKERMFGADVNVSPGTFACIAQVFDAAHGPVTMLIAHPDGSVTVGHNVIKTNAIGNWWNLKMINDPHSNGLVSIYVDNVLVHTNLSRGPREYYFKCGVYSRKDSARSEARFRDIKVWEKQDLTGPEATK
jgi:hypothetical protein